MMRIFWEAGFGALFPKEPFILLSLTSGSRARARKRGNRGVSIFSDEGPEAPVTPDLLSPEDRPRAWPRLD